MEQAASFPQQTLEQQTPILQPEQLEQDPQSLVAEASPQAQVPELAGNLALSQTAEQQASSLAQKAAKHGKKMLAFASSALALGGGAVGVAEAASGNSTGDGNYYSASHQSYVKKKVAELKGSDVVLSLKADPAKHDQTDSNHGLRANIAKRNADASTASPRDHNEFRFHLGDNQKLAGIKAYYKTADGRTLLRFPKPDHLTSSGGGYYLDTEPAGSPGAVQELKIYTNKTSSSHHSSSKGPYFHHSIEFIHKRCPIYAEVDASTVRHNSSHGLKLKTEDVDVKGTTINKLRYSWTLPSNLVFCGVAASSNNDGPVLIDKKDLERFNSNGGSYLTPLSNDPQTAGQFDIFARPKR